MSETKVNHSQKRSASAIVCPQCGHRFELPKVTHDPPIMKSSAQLRCIECGQPIPDEPLSFSGWFACKSCVLAYYQPHGAETAELEVRERRIQAARVLSRRKQ